MPNFDYAEDNFATESESNAAALRRKFHRREDGTNVYFAEEVATAASAPEGSASLTSPTAINDPTTGQPSDVLFDVGTVTTAGSNVIVAGVTGKRIVLLRYTLHLTQAGTEVLWIGDTGGQQLTAGWALVSASTYFDRVLAPPGTIPYGIGDVDEGLEIVLFGGLDVAYSVAYALID